MSDNDATDDWEEIGFLPLALLGHQESDSWAKCEINTESGKLRQVSVDKEQYEEAEEEYVNKLVELGVITEKEAEETLG